jgi:hypothetical protein
LGNTPQTRQIARQRAVDAVFARLRWERGAGADQVPGDCTLVLDLSQDEIDSLLYMYQEEKLARDVYQTLAQAHDSRLFARIAESETRHMAAVRSLLEAIPGMDVMEVDSVGVYRDDAFGDLYEQLVTEGSASLEAAYAVGVWVEEADIAELQSELQTVENASVRLVYEKLLRGSTQHLRAFQRYVAAVAEPAQVL